MARTSILSKLARKLFSRSARRVRRVSPRKLAFEALEDRCTPSAVPGRAVANTFNWFDAANWSTGYVPGPNDAVTISVAGPISIQVNGNAVVGSLTSQDNIVLGGNLAVLNGALVIDGSELGVGDTLYAGNAGTSFVANVATTANGDGFSVVGGATISLPQLTSYTQSAGTGTAVVFQANGAGSVLDLGSLTQITGGTTYGTSLLILAANGGQVDLGSVANIIDPASGNTSQRSFQIEATGTNSLIDLSGLAQVVDQNSDALSSISAMNSGTISLSTQPTQVTNTSVNVENGTLNGSLAIEAGSSLSGMGSITGDLLNNGLVQPDDTGLIGVLAIGGNYTQTTQAPLQVGIGGLSPDLFDQLTVTGNASLNGQLSTGLLNNYDPADTDTFAVVSATSVSGAFTSIANNGLPGNRLLAASYGRANVTLVVDEQTARRSTATVIRRMKLLTREGPPPLRPSPTAIRPACDGR